MPKKLTILSTIAGVAISTLGGIVPVFADTGIGYYSVPELASLHAKYAASMAECGEYSTEPSFEECYDRVTTEYRSEYGGKFESMYQLDFNGRMMVTGINPTAGTLRFYVDETKAYKKPAFEFQNLFVFWADRTVDPTPSWDDDVAWNYVDTLLSTGEKLPGFHLLYQGERGENGWATINNENRVLYDDETPIVWNNQNSHFFVLGYDTNGERHFEKNTLTTCFKSGDAEGNECRLEYYYNGTKAEKRYVESAPTLEDRLIVELKLATKNVKIAEQAALDAENLAIDANNRALDAEERAREAEERAVTAEAAANESKAEAEVAKQEASSAKTEAELAKQEAEAATAEAELARQEAESARLAAEEAKAAAEAAKSRALESEASAVEARRIAEDARAAALDAEARALEAANNAAADSAASREAIELANSAVIKAEEAARLANEIAVRSEESARIAIENAEKTTKLAEELIKSASEAAKAYEEAIGKANKLSEIAEETIKRAESISSISSTNTITKVVERIVEDQTTNDKTDDNKLQLATSDSADSSEKSIELPLVGEPEIKESKEFPWWIIVFAFSGIALIIWWFLPSRKKD